MAEGILKNSIGLVIVAIKGISSLIEEFNLRNESVLSLHREILQLRPCLENLQKAQDFSGIHNRVQRMIVLLEEIKIWMEIFAAKSTLSHFFCALVHKKEINKFYIRIQELKMEMGFEMKVDQHLYQAKIVAQMQQLIDSLQENNDLSKIHTLLEYQKRVYEMKLDSHLDIIHDIDSKYSRLVGEYETELDDMKQRTTTMQQQIDVMETKMTHMHQKISVIENMKRSKITADRSHMESMCSLPSIDSSPTRTHFGHGPQSTVPQNKGPESTMSDVLDQIKSCSEHISQTFVSESRRLRCAIDQHFNDLRVQNDDNNNFHQSTRSPSPATHAISSPKTHARRRTFCCCCCCCCSLGISFHTARYSPKCRAKTILLPDPRFFFESFLVGFLERNTTTLTFPSLKIFCKKGRLLEPSPAKIHSSRRLQRYFRVWKRSLCTAYLDKSVRVRVRVVSARARQDVCPLPSARCQDRFREKSPGNATNNLAQWHLYNYLEN